MKCLLVKTNCEVEEMDIDANDFGFVENLLDCDTLDITMSTKNCPVSVMIYLDDNGIAKNLPINYVASLAAGYGRQLHGDVIIFGLTKEWDGYSSTDLTDADREVIETFITVSKMTVEESL